MAKRLLWLWMATMLLVGQLSTAVLQRCQLEDGSLGMEFVHFEAFSCHEGEDHEGHEEPFDPCLDYPFSLEGRQVEGPSLGTLDWSLPAGPPYLQPQVLSCPAVTPLRPHPAPPPRAPSVNGSRDVMRC